MYKQVFFLFMMLSQMAFAQKIDFFQGTWEEAMAKAKLENKEIFVDIYTTWCGPCKELDRTTFRDPEFTKFISNHFVAVKVEAENGPHRNMAWAFEIGGYPIMIFMDENGAQKIQARGLKKPFALEAIGKYAMEEIELDTTLIRLINSEVSDLSKFELNYLIEHFDDFHSNDKGQCLARYHNLLDDNEKKELNQIYLRHYPFLSEGLKSYYLDLFEVPEFFDENRSQIVNDQYRVGREIEREFKIAMGKKDRENFEIALNRRMDYAVKAKQITIEEKEFLRNGEIESYDFKHKGN